MGVGPIVVAISESGVPCMSGVFISASLESTISATFCGGVGNGGGGTSAVGSPWTFGAGGGASDGLNVSDIDPITDELLDVSEGNVDEVGGIDGANDSDRTSFC